MKKNGHLDFFSVFLSALFFFSLATRFERKVKESTCQSTIERKREKERDSLRVATGSLMTRRGAMGTLSEPRLSYSPIHLMSGEFDLALQCHSSYPSFEKRWQLFVMNYSRRIAAAAATASSAAAVVVALCYIFVAHLAPDGHLAESNENCLENRFLLFVPTMMNLPLSPVISFKKNTKHGHEEHEKTTHVSHVIKYSNQNRFLSIDSWRIYLEKFDVIYCLCFLKINRIIRRKN